MDKHTLEEHQESNPCPLTAGKVSKRTIIKVFAGVFIALATGVWCHVRNGVRRVSGKAGMTEQSGLAHAASAGAKSSTTLTGNGGRLGVEPDGRSAVYLAKGDTPENNMNAILERLGGIETIVGRHDIVILKPNSQWWAQGMTNTDAMKAFMDAVLSIRRFDGEIIIADNHQFAEDNSRAWTTKKRNGSVNYNELIQDYQVRGYKNVTKTHWHVGGQTELPLEGDAQGNSKINGPEDGEGYVWMDDEFYLSPDGRKCLMTYPIFKSAHSGITVDFKNGAWKDGAYFSDRKVRFINFSALNHHGLYSGLTASVKNLMGVVDMSCGFPGNEPEGTYNTHHIGVSELIRFKKNKLFMRLISRLGLEKAYIEYCYKDFHHTGGVLGYFMRNVRMPDLNIITAEIVGWGSRVNTKKSVQTKTVLAGIDPVSLDFIAARDVLLPATPSGEHNYYGVSYQKMNNPLIESGPFFKFIKETEKQGIGNLNQENIIIHKADFENA
ncbi:hypothetical protein DSCA_12160 [Desulfosarcina alkanivorans]|uniref:DUF362 domain-containing protein n=1 Tax=Desulfosarcina alkanivorans TaxID=571177 RepID=A0A5K7YE47_9BACT|nr:DUF362 domain-containing protein [Desulfosarcina alkanivorans]BBO67286.1 hypothetical protein DSCA_12160 [Desulfosarcina alkanivorans]